jgi:hypothetical protein
MWESLQTHGTWIALGLFFLFMRRLHGRGGGRGMGHTRHGGHTTSSAPPGDPEAEAAPTASRRERHH